MSRLPGAKVETSVDSRRRFQTAFLVVLAFTLAGVLRAQGTADIVGTVTDNTGAVVPKATVTAKHLGTGLTRQTETNGAGDYAFSLLPVGDYSVSIEVMGFKTFSNRQITLATGDRARVDAQMEVGAISQSVEVAAQ